MKKIQLVSLYWSLNQDQRGLQDKYCCMNEESKISDITFPGNFSQRPHTE
jgi:hypothetical protein